MGAAFIVSECSVWDEGEGLVADDQRGKRKLLVWEVGWVWGTEQEIEGCCCYWRSPCLHVFVCLFRLAHSLLPTHSTASVAYVGDRAVCNTHMQLNWVALLRGIDMGIEEDDWGWVTGHVLHFLLRSAALVDWCKGFLLDSTTKLLHIFL